MKIAYMPDGISGKVPDEKYITGFTSCIEGNEYIASLDTLTIKELVEQLKRDTLWIMELTLRANEAMAAIEQVTKNVCLLPVRGKSTNAGSRELSNQEKHGREIPDA